MDPDLTVRRVERTAWYACASMALVALAVGRGRSSLAVAVLAGGALTGISYWSLRALAVGAGVGGPAARRIGVTAVLATVGRYALLGFLAYVMIARLRLHPVGLLAGASSFVAAVSIETLRLLIRKH